MKASELITELQKLVVEFGDLPIKSPFEFSYEPCRLVFYSVGVEQDQDPFIELHFGGIGD